MVSGSQVTSHGLCSVTLVLTALNPHCQVETMMRLSAAVFCIDTAVVTFAVALARTYRRVRNALTLGPISTELLEYQASTFSVQNQNRKHIIENFYNPGLYSARSTLYVNVFFSIFRDDAIFIRPSAQPYGGKLGKGLHPGI